MNARDFFEKVTEIRTRLKAEDLDKPLTIWLTAADDYARHIAGEGAPVELRDITLQVTDADLIQFYLDW